MKILTKFTVYILGAAILFCSGQLKNQFDERKTYGDSIKDWPEQEFGEIIRKVKDSVGRIGIIETPSVMP